MKNIILLIAVMVVGACATTSTVKSVAGTYEHKRGEDTGRFVFLDNGIAEVYDDGKKREEEGKWKLTKEGEIHVTDSNGNTGISRINIDRSITLIAIIDAEGERKDIPKDFLRTWKKIK